MDYPYGQIVQDPLNSSNHVLSFTADKSNGDAFTASSFALTPGATYLFSMKYLAEQGASPYAPYGGAISPFSNSVPGTFFWVFSPSNLTADGEWHSISYTFTAPYQGTDSYNPVWLVFEQNEGTPGTLYFDNVSLSSVPVPPAILLFGPGLVGLAAVRRRFKK